MTDQELKDIVAAVVAELEKSGVDFDYKAEPAEDGDLVFVIRGTAPNYQGVTVTWKGLLDIITAQATQAKNDAETAKNAANAILSQVTTMENNVTTMESNVSTMKTSVETTKSQVEGMKNAVETTKGQVETMKTSVETTKEEVETMKTSVETSKSQVEADKGQVETMKTSIETTKSEVETLKGQAETAQQGAEGAMDTAVAAKNSVSTMKTSVEQIVSDFNTLAAEKKAEVESVYQTDLNELKGDLSIIDGLTIEGYSREITYATGTLNEGKLFNGANYVSSSGWSALEINVVAGEKYLITGTGNPMFVVLASDDSIVDKYEPGAFVNISNYPYYIPTGAEKLVINRSRNNIPVCGKVTYEYVLSDASKQKEEDTERLKGITIENYSKETPLVTGTVHEGKLFNGTTYASVSDWNALEVVAEEYKTYYITGTGNPTVVALDSNGTEISRYESGVYVGVKDYEYTTPKGTAKIVINKKGGEAVCKEKTYNFKTNKIATLITGQKYKISCANGFEHIIGLNTSSNGLFNYEELNYMNASFKGVLDDIAPLLTDAGYIGANHGYNYGYYCTSSSHGLSETDIGKLYNDGTDNWILLKVDDSDHFTIGCYDSTVWFRLKAKEAPNTINFGTAITITSSTRKQIRPCLKNGSIDIIDNSKDSLRIREQYDIIDIGTSVDAIINNAGYNDNYSIVDLADSVFRIQTVYEFNSEGAITLYQQVELLKNNVAMLSAWYGSQLSSFDDDDLIAVPETINPILQGGTLSVSKAKWNDQNKAPSLFIKTNSAKTKGVAIAYVNDRTNDLTDSAGYVQDGSFKLYPNMIQPYTKDAGFYQNIVLRFPFVKNADGADYVSWTNVGNDVYVFIGLLSAKSVDVVIDANIYGRKSTGVVLSNCTVDSTDVITNIKVTSTSEGYALVHIHD